MDEVVTLAKKHGITTPYTSYLVVPDNVPVAQTAPVRNVFGYENQGYQLQTTPINVGGYLEPEAIVPMTPPAIPSPALAAPTSGRINYAPIGLRRRSVPRLRAIPCASSSAAETDRRESPPQPTKFRPVRTALISPFS